MTTNKTQLLDHPDNRTLFLQSWTTDSHQEKPTLLIVHGLGEHSDAYKNTALKLASHMDVLSFDFCGHGRSSGQRGYVGDIEWLLDDLATVIDQINKPLHILAHSMGGLITVTALQRKLISLPLSLLLSNPCFGLRVQVPKWKKVGAEFLTKSLPRLTLGNEISPTDLSQDSSYLSDFKKDPLRHQKISPRLYLGMMKLMNELDPQFFPSHLKTLLMLSPQDPICDPMISENYFLKNNNTQTLTFKSSLHEILNDLEKEEALKLIKEFIC